MANINMGKNQSGAKISAKSILRSKLLDLLKSKSLSVSSTNQQKKTETSPPTNTGNKKEKDIKK